MYRIPENIDVTEIQNEEITQISFGLNVIILSFSKGFIQLSGSFSIQYSNRKFKYEEVYPVQNDYGLLKLLEKKIIKTHINDGRSVLTLEFEDGTILELIGSEEYESYKLSIDGREIIV